MQIVVLANDTQKEAFADTEQNDLVWIANEADFFHLSAADAFVDLQYNNTRERNASLAQLLPKPVFINSITDGLPESHPSFIRINGWPTFLSSPVIEAACLNEAMREKANAVFAALGKQPEWLPDEPGFVTPRVVCMIINEAYLALSEGVSTKEEINTAMKLGTAYPYGPFEWAEKIGLKNILGLLQKLSLTQKRYTPAEWLVQEAGNVL